MKKLKYCRTKIYASTSFYTIKLDLQDTTTQYFDTNSFFPISTDYKLDLQDTTTHVLDI